jgi:hypothetical protein
MAKCTARFPSSSHCEQQRAKLSQDRKHRRGRAGCGSPAMSSERPTCGSISLSSLCLSLIVMLMGMVMKMVMVVIGDWW